MRKDTTPGRSTPGEGGGTLIHTEETQRGWAVRLARPVMQPAMVRFHQRWVDGLGRVAAERPPVAPLPESRTLVAGWWRRPVRRVRWPNV